MEIRDFHHPGPLSARQGKALLEFSGQVPTGNPAGEQVHKDGKVDELAAQADLGDVGQQGPGRDPELKGGTSGKGSPGGTPTCQNYKL